MSHIKPEPSTSGLQMKIVAVGGRGCNILGRLTSLKEKGADLIAIAQPGKTFDNLSVQTKIALQASGGQNIENKINEITEALSGANVIFLLGNITNDLSVANIIEVAKAAHKQDALTIFLGSSPFIFEGSEKRKAADTNKLALEKELDGVLIITPEDSYPKDVPAMEILTEIDKVMATWVNELIELVERVGVVNVDFNDFKTTIIKAGAIYFNVAKGKTDNIPALLETLFTNKNAVTSDGRLNRVLYVITANPRVSLETTEAIGKGIAARINPDARIIFGVVNDEKLTDAIKVSLIAAPGEH